MVLITLLMYPVSTFVAESSFSGIKRLKIPFRRIMSEERLSSLAILHIHKHKECGRGQSGVRFFPSEGETSRPLLVNSS